MAGNGEYQDIWQDAIPADVPFELELREEGPKSVRMKKGGSFDKWKAGIPKSNPLHQGGEHAIEFVWFMALSAHLKDELRMFGNQKITITKTKEGEKDSFTVAAGWTFPDNREGSGDARSRRQGPPVPADVSIARHLEGVILATSIAFKRLRRMWVLGAGVDDPAAHLERDKAILYASEKIAMHVSIAALDSGRDIFREMRDHLDGLAHRAGPDNRPPAPPDDPYADFDSSKLEEDEQDDLPF